MLSLAPGCYPLLLGFIWSAGGTERPGHQVYNIKAPSVEIVLQELSLRSFEHNLKVRTLLFFEIFFKVRFPRARSPTAPPQIGDINVWVFHWTTGRSNWAQPRHIPGELQLQPHLPLPVLLYYTHRD